MRRSLIICHSDYTKDAGGPTYPDNGPAIYHVLPAMFDPQWSNKNATIETFVDSNWSTVETWLSTNTYSSSYGSWYVSAFDTLMYRDCSWTGDSLYGTSRCDCGILGANCAIYPCVKTYKARVRNFVLEETEISRVALVNGSKGNGDWGYGYAMPTIVRNGEIFACGSRLEASADFSVQVYLNSTFDSTTNTSTTNYEYFPEGCVFQFSWATTWALRMFLQQNILGDDLERTTVNRPYGADGSPWLIAMFNNGSATIDTLQTYIDGVANAMTTVIRHYGDSPTITQPKGTAYSSRTCVGVRWPWLSLPATLLALAALLLGMMIWTTSRAHEIVWKSSPLPLLFHGFNEETAAKYRTIVQSKDMQEAARSIHTHLEKQQTGWYLVVT